MSVERITIAGAGLVGSLLGVLLAKRGYRVQMFERRSDMRRADISAGRSINLAMSDRGLLALEMAGVADDIRRIAIPMRGRMMHSENGDLTFQPYGVGDQAINSVSRGDLNKKLMTAAEEAGVEIIFDAKCVDVDLRTGTTVYETDDGRTITSEADITFGADGAYSAIRAAMQVTDRFDYAQSYLEHSYKELSIPAAEEGGFLIEKNALHIWPRHSFMMIALPNIDGSFTVTLFLAHKGDPSFAQLTTDDDIMDFFRQHFADAIPVMPTLLEDFHENPESSLVTVKCSPWVMNDRVALIGDAAHAIVPFYGQGMNAGFEDCRVLMDCLDVTKENWPEALQLYRHYREKEGFAIADLAVGNFYEMRDKVADERFLRRKKIEAFLHETFPTKWIPQYSLVTFAEAIPYTEAMRIGKEQDVIMERLMKHDVVYEAWSSDEARPIIEEEVLKRPDLTFAPVSPK
jgi:kynurenine 3-monooxygenase